MEILRAFPNLIQSIAEQVNTLGGWFTSEIAEINGTSITPLTIMLPSILIVILGYVIIRFLLV